jgi:hypothetical protein
MGRTRLKSDQVEDGEIKRADLDAVTPGSAVIRKVIAGSNVVLISTGGDSGTGDVTISASTDYGSIIAINKFKFNP